MRRGVAVVLAAIGALCLLVLAGCSGGDNGGIPPTSTREVAGAGQAAGGQPADPTRKIVVFAQGTPAARRATVVQADGGQVLGDLPLIGGVATRLNAQAEQKLLARREVVRISPDQVRHLNPKPDSPPGQSHHGGKKPGPPQTLEWDIDRIDAEFAHQAGYTGAGVKVAVIDTGVAKRHEDLHVAGGLNCTFFGNPNDWDDWYGHGTHVAGTIAGLDNSVGVVGVAPDADLYALRVMDSLGLIWDTYIISALGWSVDHGIQVVNMSLGGDQYSAELQQACDAAAAAGIIVVASAGNDGTNSIDYPAAFASVIAVGATDINDLRASFSDYGTALELVAPGVQVRSTCTGALDGSIYDGDGEVNGYAILSGTSMSSPHVAGTAALVIQSGQPNVRQVLQNTADDLGAAGRDDFFGHGLVDAEQAAAGTENGDNLPPPT